MRPLFSLITFLIYPVWLPLRTWENKQRTAGYKVLTTLFSLLFLLPVWIACYFFCSIAVVNILQYTGYVQVAIPVSGSSMLPTLKESGFVDVRHFPQYTEFINLKKYFDTSKWEPDIKRGDLIVFRNLKTKEIFEQEHVDAKGRGGFVKRVLGTEGDIVTIRDGFVYVNNQIVSEPYILKPRSTFGGDFMPDCTNVQVPKGKYLVLGDNRKVSVDSRQIGLIDKKDVYYYLPYSDQLKEYRSRWRDVKNDVATAHDSTLDIQEYVRLLNEKRKANNREPLKYQPKLSQTAEKRAQVILSTDDTSFEATKSGYTMVKAMDEVGYSNIVYGEFPVVGYYDAQELVDAIFEYPSSRDFMLGQDYQDVGVSTFVGNLNGCPVQIVVQHMAGYKPPTYSTQDIQDWKALIAKLSEIKQGWQDLKSKEDFYKENKADIDRINEIIDTRSTRAAQIVKRMEANEWFTKEEESFVSDDKTLVDEQNALADKINKKITGSE